MRNQGVAMLFVPPNPPMTVPRTRAVVMGRSPQCDLPVPSRRASRKHAQVRREGDVFLVEDLGSTNGTFLNGEKIDGPTQLNPGDKIDVGGSQVTFCQVQGNLDVGFEANDEEKTVLFAGPLPSLDELEAQGAELAKKDALSGSLAEIPPPAVMQLLEMGRKTGKITFEPTAGDVCYVWLVQGRLMHAEHSGKTGFDAAAQLVRIHEGSFEFDPGEEPTEHSLNCAVTEFLLDASRQLDEDQANV